MLELYGRSGLPQFDQFYTDVNPFEVDVAGRWGVTSMVSLLAGGGAGIGTGIGAPELRFFAGLTMNEAAEMVVDVPEPALRTTRVVAGHPCTEPPNV